MVFDGGLKDPRVLIMTGFVSGVFVWKAPLLALAGLALLFLTIFCGCRLGSLRAFVRTWVVFAVYWALMAYAADRLTGVSAEAALFSALLFFGRLMTLFLGSAVLLRLTTATGLAMALAWSLRPFIGRYAAELALALFLMLNALMRLRSTWQSALAAVRLRLPRASWATRIRTVLLHAVATVQQSADRATDAVVVRGLNREAAWKIGTPLKPGSWIFAAAVAALEIAVCLV